ncbi:MAG: hypothetical protein U0Q12_03165 [Vicinamibacterales bacterium]
MASLLLVWINFATTRRWADVPGALHGPKRWLFVEALVVATLFAVRPWQPSATHRRMSHATCLVGIVLLVVSFFIWFPSTTWSQIPFLDNWPARYQSTVDALALYRQGVAAGWEWHFLGGYHLLSDVTVTGWFSYFLVRRLAGAHGVHPGRARREPRGRPRPTLRWCTPRRGSGGCHLQPRLPRRRPSSSSSESLFDRDRHRLVRAALAVALGLGVGLPLTFGTTSANRCAKMPRHSCRRRP